MTQTQAVLSVDLEYFDQIPAYRSAAGTTDEPTVGRDGAVSILDALAEASANGTFFTVSTVAEQTPGLLDRVVAEGHEVASHTHTHRHLTELTTEQRRSELRTSKDRLEAATGQAVSGFRAPSFDIADDHFEMLGETGYTYDSSVIPCRSIPGWYGGEYDRQRPASAREIDPSAPEGLTELPVAVFPGLGLPLTGTWIRFFGVHYTIAGMRLLARRGIAPVIYVHPWELVDLPAVEGVPKRVYVRTGAYMRRAIRKLLAQPFEFVTARELAAGGRS